WGGMGGACMMGLGLAIAQPARRVLVVTGDGEMLMGLGSLATIAVQRPSNLAIVVLDNARFGETGMQPSHTAGPTRLVAVANGCGIATCLDVTSDGALDALAADVWSSGDLLFARVGVSADELPRVLPERDGAALKTRFRRALGLPGPAVA
ncbi:MAG TPA: thiamine pyrophosphate-dependent enzyme, partial [Gemmatimonadaceae bacterium]|nr:thiamine pyrophosphate-dependent enzyme [Gemmatimonadaceae bacterium]